MYYRNNTQVITKIFCDASFCMGVDRLNNGRSTQEVFLSVVAKNMVFILDM